MMKRKFLAAFALAMATAGLLAQPAAGPVMAQETLAAAEQLAGHLLLSGQAYDYDRQLADGIGPRLTGSANYEKATDWAIAEFTRLGLRNVHRESWIIPAAWEPETAATGRMISPREQRLHVESEGWSPSTPAGGVRGPVFHLSSENSADAIRAEAEHIKGAIILIDGDSRHAGPDASEGTVADNDALLAKLGAVAILTDSAAAQNAPTVGNSVWNGTLLPLPTANLGLEDTLLLRRLLAAGPVTIEFSFRNRIREHVKVDNVVAEIAGREKPGDFVLIGAHLDSWNPGTGAEDNGTGVAAVMAIAQAAMAVRAPRRTLRFALFGGEEEGLLGSHAYAKAHEAELAHCDAVIVTDSGGEAPKGWVTLGRQDVTTALGPLKPMLSGMDADGTTEFGRLAFGTDEGDFVARGIPSLVLWTGVDKYRGLHHKPSDTFDKVDARDLGLGAAVVGVTAYAIADLPQAFAPHLSAAEVEEQMKQIKMFDEFKDMRDRGMLF